MAERLTFADGWQPIDTIPTDDERYDDLPGDAEEGVGFSTAADDGRVLCLLWWKYVGNGCSETTHWRPLPEAPGPAPTEAVA